MQHIRQNVSLADYSTMGLGGSAAYAIDVHNLTELTEAVQWAQERHLPMLMIGGGSNIIWRDEGFPGLILINSIKRYETLEEDEQSVCVAVGSGEIWDTVVERAVTSGLTGIETLSLIPGSTGATPVQNVGAYGQEISDTLVTVEAYDLQTGDHVAIAADDCGFGYRTSRFKTTDRGRFLITGITLRLTKGNPSPPFYGSLQAYLDQHNITEHTPASIREAVIAIRSAKLPDPQVIHNCGSFFSNPVVSETQFQKLSEHYPQIPHWQSKSGIKISAAWLVGQAGFKDVHDAKTGMGTWPAQSLVLVNEHARNTADLLAFRDRIAASVKEKFSISLEQEPELLP